MGRAGKTVPPRSSGSHLKKGAHQVDRLEVTCAKPTEKQHPQSHSFMRQKWPPDVLKILQTHHAFMRQQPVDPPQYKKKGKRHHEEISKDSNATIDLPVQQPSLPFPWERFLDLKTGEIYYIDWSCCKRTHRDPRELLESAKQQIKTHTKPFLEESDATSGLDTAESDNEWPNKSSKCAVQKFVEEEEEADDEDENVMVAMGCCQCLSYFMLPKLTPNCPHCHGDLLQP